MNFWPYHTLIHLSGSNVFVEFSHDYQDPWRQQLNSHMYVLLKSISFHYDKLRCHQWEKVTIFFSVASRVTQKSLFTVTNVLVYFLHAILCPWTHNSTKNNYRLPISPLSLRIAISDLALWCHYSWSVTSRERGLLALWRHIRGLFLHVQIGANAIFTCE